MRGVGGPLLSIGDLLADLVEETVESAENDPNRESCSKVEPDAISGPLDLTRLFQVLLRLQFHDSWLLFHLNSVDFVRLPVICIFIEFGIFCINFGNFLHFDMDNCSSVMHFLEFYRLLLFIL